MPDSKVIPGGRPLDPTTRKKLEDAFGADLSEVRVHVGPSAGAAARAVGAKAYSQGNHIFFPAGAYQPNTPYGRKLLAHEVAHVLQQRKNGSKSPDPLAEKQAEKVAEQVVKKLR